MPAEMPENKVFRRTSSAPRGGSSSSMTSATWGEVKRTTEGMVELAFGLGAVWCREREGGTDGAGA
ncbi:hypothetical protein GCM10009593_15560 [Microlunatus antarcticus]